MFGVCSGVCFQVPCWMLYSPMGAQPLGFASLPPFGGYLCQAYVQPGDGNWPTPGIHRVAAPSTALRMGEPSAMQTGVPQPSYLYGEAYSFRGLAESPDPSAFPAWWGGVFFSRFGSIQ